MKQNSSNRSCNSPMNIEDRGLPIESEVTRNDSKMKNIAESVVEERRVQYNDVMKRWIDLGKKDGIADVTTSTDLHVRDILLINRINLSRKGGYTDWCSELPQGVTYVDGQRGHPFWDRIDQQLLNQKLFDENSYCHGYIIGVQEGWAKIEGLVTGRSEAPISEITPEAPPPYPPIPKKS
jgi:hypothetical protein